MVIDFSNVNIKERPRLILKNLDGTVISYLGYALEPKMNIVYNEVSELTFRYPSHVDGVRTDAYVLLRGMRIVEVQGLGQFVLLNPVETYNGLVSIKTCKAYSLDFEFTYKLFSLAEGTYNFWNPVTPDSTVIGMIMADMPSWSLGYVSPSLIGKYRTFSVDDINIYDFIKSTLQETYGCIFEFDTDSRTLNVRDVNDFVASNAVYLSTSNLLKEIQIEEDTESVITALDVYGAEGVTIRSVNPMGTNRIYNLDAYMNTDNFSQELIDRWSDWKAVFSNQQLPYYNLTVEHVLQITKHETESAALSTLEGELTNLESQQATIIQAISNGLSPQSELTAINAKIAQKQSEINAKNGVLTAIKNQINNLQSQLKAINLATSLETFFTSDEMISLDRYFKCGSINDSSFVSSEVNTYATEYSSFSLGTSTFTISASQVESVDYTSSKTFYSVRCGTISNGAMPINADIIRGTLEVNSDNSFVFSAYLDKGTFKGESFPSASLSAIGTISSVSSNDSSLSFAASSATVYFTKSVTEYQKKAIEWELFEYGLDQLRKMSQPSFSFSVDSANFFLIDEFAAFASQFRLGERVYLEIEDGKTLEPIVVAVDIDFDNPSNFSISFGDTFNLNDSAFKLEDLLGQSITMGKNLNSSKHNYSSFVTSGANTAVNEYINSALDVGKNKIMSSFGQAVSWDAAGLRLRKWRNAILGTYEPEQIWMANNSIMFTNDGWDTAVMGVGKFTDKNLGDMFGFVGPSIVGTLFAGKSMVLESEKQDGGVSVFKVDAEGASLHNASFNLYGTSGGRINLDPDFGILGGHIGTAFEYDSFGNVTGVKTMNGRVVRSIAGISGNDAPNSNFWLDMNGDIYLKGTVHATDGEFTGTVHANSGSFTGSVTATDFYFKNGSSVRTLLSSSDGKEQIDHEFLNLKGLTINNGVSNTLEIDMNGNISMRGNITMNGGNITWANVNRDPTIATAQNRANSAYNYAEDAYYNAEAAYSTATTAADLARRIANGTFSGGTFINGTEIYSPTIYANEFNIMPRTVGNATGGYNIYGYYNSQLYHFLRLEYGLSGGFPAVTFDSPRDAYAHWNFNKSYFRGSIDFGGADVTGITATFA